MTTRRGFTLLEVIISTLIMGGLIASLTAITVRLSGTDLRNETRTGQSTALRRSTAYWSAVPYAALPAPGTSVCDTVAVAVPVLTCAAAVSITSGGVTRSQITVTATALQGMSIASDATVIDRVPGT